VVWIEMAGITTPFTTPTFPFLQTVTQRSLDGVNPAFLLKTGPSVAPIAPTASAGLGQGVFAVDNTLGSGYAQQWNLAVQRELGANFAVEVAYAGGKGTRIGVPDTNINQLTAAQLALGNTLLERVPNPCLGVVPPSSSIGTATVPRAQALRPALGRQPISRCFQDQRKRQRPLSRPPAIRSSPSSGRLPHGEYQQRQFHFALSAERQCAVARRAERLVKVNGGHQSGSGNASQVKHYALRCWSLSSSGGESILPGNCTSKAAPVPRSRS
jgi:hypothetical protein